MKISTRKKVIPEDLNLILIDPILKSHAQLKFLHEKGFISMGPGIMHFCDKESFPDMELLVVGWALGLKSCISVTKSHFPTWSCW